MGASRPTPAALATLLSPTRDWQSRLRLAPELVVCLTSPQVKYWEDTFASKGVTLHVPTLCPAGEYTITTALQSLTAFIDGASPLLISACAGGVQ